MTPSNRPALKAILDYVTRARNLATTIPVEGEHATTIGQMVNGLIDAEHHGFNLLENTSIRCGDNAPLNSEEEAVFHQLPKYLRFSPSQMDALTFEQKFSAARVIVHQGGPDKIRHPVSGGALKCDPYLGISFGHIFIGIEKDGYAHS